MTSENPLQITPNKPRYSIISLILPLLAGPVVYTFLHKSTGFNGLFYPLLAIIAVAVIGVSLAIMAFFRKERPIKFCYIGLGLNIVAGLVSVAYLFALFVFSLIS